MTDPNNDSCMLHLRRREPCLWINPGWRPAAEALTGLDMGLKDVVEADDRLRRFAPLLADLFPELRGAGGVIESEFRALPTYAALRGGGALWMKADYALPVAGSIKARGGIYAVLEFAERVALRERLFAGVSDDYRKLSAARARETFARYELSVGSTGNLGLSIGVMGSALGFRTTVHMSAEAKEWKKARLRARGVRVVEHSCDYTGACVEARRLAALDPRTYFIDDENSRELFLGYSTAALRLRHQLERAGLTPGPDRPLLLYLPCGVGGAPGGITFGARCVFGDDAHCFFAEPVEAPCMTLGMLTGRHADISVYDIGLDLRTDADGLAVSRPSRFVGAMMERLVSGLFTVADDAMYRDLLALYESEGIELEPSACAGFPGPRMLASTAEGLSWLHVRGLTKSFRNATHVLWTTGGSLVPAEQHTEYRRKAAHLART